MYHLGLDIGSSSIKAALVEVKTGKSIAVVQEPQEEMGMFAEKSGWAEQKPEDWWKHVCKAITRLKKQYNISRTQIKGIGIAYQMHGLVVVDKEGMPLRKSIIWCDSRAVETGNKAFEEIGEEKCTSNLLNSPGNFTASKLKWVKENEPEIYKRIYKLMLPGDYIAYKFSNTINTTISGLSEGVFWDFKKDTIADFLLEHYGIDKTLVPDIVETFGVQCLVDKKGEEDSGIATGTPIYYRAGDQPNNALSLNVFNPGEVAATGGTSGVVYAITNSLSVKESARVNNFAHSSYKYEKGGKGIGRITWLRAFNSVNIESIYKYNGSFHKRTFDFKRSRDGIENPLDIDLKKDNEQRRTIVHLKSLSERFQRWTNSDLEEIAIKIIEHCFSFFREENCPRIILKDSDDSIVVNDYFHQYTRDALDKETHKIKGKYFDFEVVKMYSSRPDNKIHYRAHRREVMNDKLTDFIPELKQLLTDDSGEKFSIAVYVSSDYLDEKVNEERTEISFSTADAFFPDEIEKNDVSEKAVEIVRSIYKDFIDEIEKARLDNIRNFVQHHPQYRYLEKYKLEGLKKISSKLSGKKLELELFKLQNELEREVRQEANKMLKSIKILDHKADFDAEHLEIYNKVIEVGNSKLAEYVVHRSYILKHLESHLKKSEKGKYSKEEIIHNLIFPLKKTSDDIQLEEHNLWVIDERLAFHDYLASDKALTSIERTESKSLKRPDLVVFNQTHLLNDDDKYASVVLVEFKKPMRDDYSESDNPISQITDYTIELQSNNAVDKNGRPISIRKGTPFYGYIISDLTPKLRILAQKAGFTKHPDNDGYFTFNPNFELYIEIISFDKMVRDSKKRNQILFNKLNLPTD